ncbi:hypothetical protein GCM10011297_15310 [Bacterioplanes sanyensis]|uniref:DUF4124 domain-containing protein n=1 Tax=Bacterioplanes sanyensis TaxID=1249553 RepID=UPI001678F203|nr:DUF4124 domain-containing protein [Bacterioplanes sanyensis]GGY43442.1 hypothetical protein GCM10011297_15310 [Bacterioplanes sanyensis]
MVRTYLLAGLVLANVAAADVYRWTDEEGRVHFGDQPPRATQQAEKVNIQVPQSTGNGVSFERRQRQQEMLQSWQQERNTKREKREMERAKKEKQEALCKQLLAEKLEAERSTHVYKLNDQGEREYFDEEKAQQYLQKTIARYNEECG